MKSAVFSHVLQAPRRRLQMTARGVGGLAAMLAIVTAGYIWYAYYFPVRTKLSGAVYDGQTHGLGFAQFSMHQLGSWFNPPATFRCSWDLPSSGWFPPAPPPLVKETSAVLPRVALVRQFYKRLGLEIFGRGYAYNTYAEYLVFDDDSAFHREISNHLSEDARDFVAANATGWDWDDTLDSLRTSTEPGDTFWQSQEMDLICCTPNIVSLFTILGSWPTTGGAQFATVFNFINYSGHARPFTEANLFVPNSGWEQKLSDLCMAKLRSDHADSVTDGTVKSFNPQELSRFTVTPEALQIYFYSGEVESGGGDTQVDIPWAALRGYLRPMARRGS